MPSLKITWQEATLKAAPSPPPPQDRTETPCSLLVLHAPDNRGMCKVWHLWMLKGWTTLYGWIPLVWMLKSGPFPQPSTQGDAAGPYFPKAHDQREQKYCGEHFDRPGPLPGRLLPRRSVIITPCPKQRCGWDRSNGRRWCRSRGPRAHRYHRPQKRHTNGHWEQKKIQTMKNQWNVPPIHQDLPPTLTVMSR